MLASEEVYDLSVITLNSEKLFISSSCSAHHEIFMNF